MATALCLSIGPRPGIAESTAAGDGDDREWGDWPRWDDVGAERATGEVNEGRLSFLRQRPDGRLHHHANRITIAEQSLRDGWVELQQCHEGLDPVPRLQIVYHPQRVRRLRVTEQRDVQRAEVVGSRVELRGVGRDARICISARSLALVAGDDGSFVLRNGPFMRRFLDGFYPMRVSMAVRWPTGTLRLGGVQPAAQPGFHVTEQRDGVDFEALFEGRLSTRIHLFPSSAASAGR